MDVRQAWCSEDDYVGRKRRLSDLFHLDHVICRGRDLNPYGRNDRGILSPLCLPISPPRQKAPPTPFLYVRSESVNLMEAITA